MPTVCGPAVTPPDDSLLSKISGLIHSFSPYRYRFFPSRRRDVSDYPSCNFLLRATTYNQVGKFNTPHWPGEDTFLCLKIISSGYRIVYDPRIITYHYRRPLFKKHLQQLGRYAKMRGYFFKHYPKNSRSFVFLIPSVFTLFIIGFVLTYVWYGIMFLFGLLKK